VVEALKGLVHEAQPFFNPVISGGFDFVVHHALPFL
jgi:hypothetical protein